jgi:hypothetical protein
MQKKGRTGAGQESDHYPNVERMGTETIPLPIDGYDDSKRVLDDY